MDESSKQVGGERKAGRKTVIIGGVAGGASCAARLRRLDEGRQIVLLERGPYISYANCGLPYHVGGTIRRREALLVTSPETMRKRFRVDVSAGDLVLLKASHSMKLGELIA